MKEKVVELLVLIMSEMQENKRISDIDLAELRTRGYTQSEISAAFTWIYENIELDQQRPGESARPSPGSRRILHEAEKAVLATDAQGYLIQLSELGLLSESEFETVIERAMMAGFEKLSVAEIREIVASVLFARGGDDRSGNRSMLNTGDTIH
jgi:Smg protein